jgi:tRNA A-37 threonylcarbamoyl transferase component Bud32
MTGRPSRPPSSTELLAQAERAERAGDAVVAAATLRVFVERHPTNGGARLRFARALVAAGERTAARAALDPLEAEIRDTPSDDARAATRALAELDEADGAHAQAIHRWERLLADDLDDAQARAHLRALRPDVAAAPANASETLVSPEGLETSRYRLRRELGRGATAAVYLATDGTLAIDVALKVLHPQLADSLRADARRRFFAEGRVAAAIRHRGVIAIYDLDESARVLAMEHVAGGTLSARLAARAGAPTPRDELVATAATLLEALAHVHERGVTHGDLKPSNLLLRAPGDVVLADFGAAELRDDNHTTSDGGAGTPQYLAPERLRGARPSAAADLYAAGAVLWELAAGRPLRTHAELLRGATDAPPLPPAARDALGVALADLVATLVATTASARPRAREALVTLNRC